MLHLTESSRFTPIGLPQQGLDLGNDVVVLGWGQNDDGQLSDSLQESNLGLIPNEECAAEDVWGKLIKHTMACAFGFGNGEKGNGADTCEGEYGGLTQVILVLVLEMMEMQACPSSFSIDDTISKFFLFSIVKLPVYWILN